MWFKMEMVVVLSYLSQHKGYLVLDMFLYLLMLTVAYLMSTKVLRPHIPEDRMVSFEKWNRLVSFLLIAQLALMLIQLILLASFPPTSYGHPYMTWSVSMVLQTLLFILISILRVMNLALLTGVIVLYSKVVRDRVKPLFLASWVSTFLLAVFIQLYTLIYTLFPSMNPVLGVYESFYNVRSIFLNPALPRKQKFTLTNSLLQEMVCSFGDNISTNAKEIVQDQLKHTFRKHPDILAKKCEPKQQQQFQLFFQDQ